MLQDRRVQIAVIAVLAAALLTLAYFTFLAPRLRHAPEGGEAAPAPTASGTPAEGGAPPAGGPTVRVTLYFEGSETGLLYPEVREVQAGTGRTDAMRAALRALATGPSGDLLPVIPAGAQVQGVYLLPEGTLIVDFSAELSTAHSGGSDAEIRTVFAVVDTVVQNFPEVQAVQILVDGKQVQTLAGHVYLLKPLKPDWGLLATQ